MQIFFGKRSLHRFLCHAKCYFQVIWCSFSLPEGLVSRKCLRYFKIFYPRNILRKFCVSERNLSFWSWLANVPICGVFEDPLKIRFYDMSSFQMPKASLDTYHTPHTNMGHSFLVGCGTEHRRLNHCQPAVEAQHRLWHSLAGENCRKMGHRKPWAMQNLPVFYRDIWSHYV